VRKLWTFSREQNVRILGWGIRFFLAAALTAAQLPGGYVPFALGCVSAAGPGAEGMSALLGAGVGMFLFLDFNSGLAQLAAAILICTAATAFRGLRISEKPSFGPLCAAGLFLAVKGIYVIQSANPIKDLFPCLTAVILTGISAWSYAPLMRPGQERLEPRSVLFLTISLLSALAGVGTGELDLGRTLLCAVVMTVAWQYGVTAGAGTGLCAGLLMDLCGGTGTLFFSAAWGVAGLAAGIRKQRGRISAAAMYMAVILALLLPMTDSLAMPLLEESLCGAGLFLLMPKRAFGGKRLQRPEAAAPSAMEGIKARIARTAAAFHDIYDSLGRGATRATEENPAVIFDRAAEKVCRECSLCNLCWKREYVSTFDAMNDATPYLLDRGRALAKDFPQHFTDRCIHMNELLTAMNGELSAFLLRRQYRRQLEETRRSARGQYAQLGELLSATAAGLGETRSVAGLSGRPYRIGAALRPKEGESVCGDSVSSFETETGRLCLLLSDGCGSGEGARKESALTSRLLRQFLEAGIETEASLKTLNAALALRSEETGSFATIDLMTVELHSGEASLYKYGAAPTYIKKNGSVRRITGGTLPAGLREPPASPDVTRFPMEEGSFAIMVSDGVTDAGHDEWLQNLLAGWDGDDPQALAGLVVQEAARRGSLADDCGVQVLYLPREAGLKKRV
jgi:stage II sporulation protein E